MSPRARVPTARLAGTFSPSIRVGSIAWPEMLSWRVQPAATTRTRARQIHPFLIFHFSFFISELSNENWEMINVKYKII
jgi:hypothetical protein